ncbi:glycoside hydrolase family 43 protein [Lachnoclostridium sp. Marseille-P6806]|uniref:glycoside hydrolase family 43 protein n=1 Tax=Lachnoclostridium sp. Marseille-P6806 TaxID=2364793 RepID=UPI00103144F6|nr:glycoside hydrolase family 43 protein [Lachnoclostridium sp. Marseille-P6806]
MKLHEINIRDPFVLAHNGVYYMTGTRAATTWTDRADGFDGYYSRDLINWEGPVELFHRPEGFWADKCYWAPEIHFYNGYFYLFATFANSAENRKGTVILRAASPLGPYRLHSEGKITPEPWQCLDGTFYLDRNGRPWMVFSHEWTDLGDGQICAVPLSSDLTRRDGTPRALLQASDAGWARAIRNRQWDGPAYVTDGPFLWRRNSGELIMLWATFGEKGYAEAVARSDNGDITGRWTVDPAPLFAENGGHGMLFSTFDGKTKLVLYQPNTSLEEHPVFLDTSL